MLYGLVVMPWRRLQGQVNYANRKLRRVRDAVRQPLPMCEDHRDRQHENDDASGSSAERHHNHL